MARGRNKGRDHQIRHWVAIGGPARAAYAKKRGEVCIPDVRK
jgi:hypothetical protein